ncbi:cbb3-type cytochrome oxidase subunit 3 [Aliikangiella coralliicola]|uniref:Cbb3-type cytochrome c oxidase subunit 3 n=1 Tax=Aliikangiella coralliicola TaxID=2592383 RepID=A0A545UDF9_9GAMM|nr:cbb3-type cytochrome c oxidase subunit 3 [Aliikangiella coralliicola]TQV87498.1 cbb3-type cytochrome c oxidase subunit 3 [Aliikangiella coralliicola]
MDINLIRSLITLALFVLFIVLIYQVFSKKNKRHYEDAANLVFNDGDERSEQINQDKTKVKNHD